MTAYYPIIWMKYNLSTATFRYLGCFEIFATKNGIDKHAYT